MFIFSDSSLCRTRQPAWFPGLVVTTTSRRFLLAYTGFKFPYASESSTRRLCLCGSIYTMQPLATWLTCVCRPTPCVAANNCVPRRLELCWSRAPGCFFRFPIQNGNTSTFTATLQATTWENPPKSVSRLPLNRIEFSA